MGVTQEGEKCIFMLYMKVAEKDTKVHEETVRRKKKLKLL